MTKTLKDLQAEADAFLADEQARAEQDAMIEAPTGVGARDESPEFDASELLKVMNEPRESRVRQPDPEYVRAPSAREDSPIVAQLRASALAAGVLTVPAQGLSNILDEYRGVGAFQRTGFLARACVVTVASTVAGLWSVRTLRPDRELERELQREHARPVAGAAPACGARGRTGVAADARAAGPVDAICLDVLTWDELDALAA